MVAFALGPIEVMVMGFVARIPSLVFLVVLFYVVRLLLKMIRMFFDAVGEGTVKLQRFDQDWAVPTYKIVRLAVIALALVVAYPYIPGSGSAAFGGVSLFIGVLFSLGSSTAIANIIAGYMLTYRHALKAGEREFDFRPSLRIEIDHQRDKGHPLPRHGAVQRLQLLVEERPQAIELFSVAKLLRADNLVISAGEHLVAEGFGVIEHRLVGAPWLRPAQAFGHVGVAVEAISGAVVALIEALLGHGVLIGLRFRSKIRALLAVRVFAVGIGGGRFGFAVITLPAFFAFVFELVA